MTMPLGLAVTVSDSYRLEARAGTPPPAAAEWGLAVLCWRGDGEASGGSRRSRGEELDAGAA